MDLSGTAGAVGEDRRRIETAQQPVSRIQGALFLSCADNALIERDHQMEGAIMRTGRIQRVRRDPDADLLATARTTGRGVIGKKGIPAGMQDIKGTTAGSRDLPGSDAIVAFTGRIQSDINIIALFIEEPQVAYRPGIDKEIFDVGSLQVFVTTRKSDVFQQSVEYIEPDLIILSAIGVPDRRDKQRAGRDPVDLLQKGELRMIAQFLRKISGPDMLIELK